MYFKAVITDEETRIQATRDIRDAMIAVTMICHDVNGIKEYSEADRAIFRGFVKEELAKLAFTDVDELIKEEERLTKLREKENTDFMKLLKKLRDLLDEIEDEDEDEDET